MERKTKTVKIDSAVIESGVQRAERLGLNFSQYLAALIRQDLIAIDKLALVPALPGVVKKFRTLLLEIMVIERAEERARRLGLTFSQYSTVLIRQDVAKGGFIVFSDITVEGEPPDASKLMEEVQKKHDAARAAHVAKSRKRHGVKEQRASSGH